VKVLGKCAECGKNLSIVSLTYPNPIGEGTVCGECHKELSKEKERQEKDTNLSASQIVSGGINVEDVQGSHYLISDVSRGSTFVNLVKAIDIFTEKGWKVVGFEVIPISFHGTSPYQTAWVLMERQ